MKKLDASLVYWIASFGSGFIFSIVFGASQIYRVQTVGLDALQLVLVGTTLEVTAFLFEIPTGVVADVYSRRLSIIIGTFLFGLGFLVEGALPYFAAILVAQVIWGTGWTFISGAMQAWIADEVGSEQAGVVYLRSTQLREAGHLLGIPFFVLLANLNYQVPILVGGVLFLLQGLFWLLFAPETGFTRQPAAERESWQEMWGTLRAGLVLARRQPQLWSYIGIALFIGLYSEGYDRLSDAHFIQNFRFPALPWGGDPIISWFALMRLVGTGLVMALTEFAKRRLLARSDAQQNGRIVRLLQGIYGLIVVGLLIFAWTQNFYLAVLATLMIDSLRATSGPLTTTWLNQYIDSRVRATVLSLTSQVDALGQMGGGPVVGLIGNLRSLRAALTASALLLTPAVPLFARSRRKFHPD
ncbi:MAG: MFS transporter [Anaerolineales bacterium]|nr:MFS transporter [Anaerolineales bacterium]